MLRQISVVIIARDAQATLRETLASLARFAEVVLYDNGSQDDTLAIAADFPNVRIHRGEFFGFGPTKNHALDLAENDWVFSLDSDEVLPEALIDELAGLRLDDPLVAYEVRRDNHFMGAHVRRGGWGDDWLVRVFNRTRHRFDDAMVHEKVHLHAGTKLRRLDASFVHNAVTDIGQFLEKVNRYSDIRKQTSDRTFHPLLIVLRSAYAFFRSYVLKLGFLAGWRGLVIAVSNANGVFFKYMKVYAKQRS